MARAPASRAPARPGSRLAELPFFVLLMGLCSAAGLLPAVHALTRGDRATGLIFLAAAAIGAGLTLILALATATGRARPGTRDQLFTLVMAFAVLPVLLAVPLMIAVGDTTLLRSWFEMVSSLTTTGATVFDRVDRLNPSLHLWRATVGWLGGFLMWVMAFAVLAPMNIGGFEVRHARGFGEGGTARVVMRAADPSERLARYAARLLPIYVGLTAVLWLGLLVAGEVPIVAICHAMSTLSTSGISPIGGVPFGASGIEGEVLIFLFMAFAVSRLTWSRGLLPGDHDRLIDDPEVRLAAILIGSVTLFLFARHFLGAGEAPAETEFAAAATALWGALFTVASFLTTTGFESYWWIGAADWSGLRTPGFVLIGLAIVGGGVATTAGGVKLLRIYALARHGERELERLIHPHSIGGSGVESRRVRKEGARMAWIFFMLFAMSIFIVMGALALTGVQFETALVLAVSALSTTGPLAHVAAEHPVSYAGIPDTAKAILAAAMVVGRLEALALIALLNPELWRN
ncbi:TrkH family potassium uptake protein [Wenxinia marina]|uniref:Wenxma_20, whole genome shotgun sequence n=1 Tax=Wenxinia marina DSM 24838 TaxID=1123501 RepID=A0A0D0Q569_9RHOB|nr:potassium transporter TrkG [Wenxinia marina]KIQ67657.1 Trk-type K+ transport system, membrane component [Wenxinia marina DSM 24838]GGL79946.1 potassium transporter TrkH [Wenxinia marina]